MSYLDGRKLLVAPWLQVYRITKGLAPSPVVTTPSLTKYPALAEYSESGDWAAFSYDGMVPAFGNGADTCVGVKTWYPDNSYLFIGGDQQHPAKLYKQRKKYYRQIGALNLGEGVFCPFAAFSAMVDGSSWSRAAT